MKKASDSDLHVRRTAAQMHALAAVRREMRSRDSATSRKYLREFTEAFRRYDAVLSPQQLNEKFSASGTLLVGDYHALPASQRFAAELIERQCHSRQVVVGLEAILSRDQHNLDAWWRREMAEAELRIHLRFDRDWGYDWSPFYDLLTAARDHAEGICGLDCEPRHDLRRIGSRDRHAAAKICQMRREHPDALVIVLFGESHMAPQHLPRLVREQLPEEKITTVLQNIDAIYWQAVADKAAAVSIGEETICVFNSSPLEKYESYRLCFERWNSAIDELPDFAPAVYNLIFSLARSLGFRLDSPRNGTQPKFLSDSLPEVLCLNSGPAIPLSREYSRRLEEQGCVYIPDKNTFLVDELRVTHVAKEAARFLHHACRGMTKISVDARPVEDMLADFGSRLLCPAVDEDGQASTQDLAGALYRGYLDGRVTKSALRRIFLTQIEDREQAAEVLTKIAEATRFDRAAHGEPANSDPPEKTSVRTFL